MKKIITLLFFALSLVCFSLFISAANVPVKDAWFISGDGEVLVLCENGNLFIGESIGDDTPSLIYNDIQDVYITEPNNGRVYGGIIHKNGDISLICIEYCKVQMEKKLSVNAKKIFYAGYDTCIYINNKNELIVYYEGNTVVANDVKKALDFVASDMYYIDNSDTLNIARLDGHILSPYTVDSQDYVMSNVQDIDYTKYSVRGGKEFIYLVLKNNGDLYMIDTENNSIPERIGKNVESLEKVKAKVVHYGGIQQKHYCIIDYVDKNGGFYVYNTNKKTAEKYYTDVKSIYHFQDSKYVDQRYIVSKNNTAYYCGSVEGEPYSTRHEIAKNIGGFFTGTKNIITYTSNPKSVKYIAQPNKSIISNVKKVINNTSLYNQYSDYMFIKENGELWASKSISSSPFLTAFSKKPTNFYINGRSISLVSEIQIVNDRSMYPFRECLENMGATVFWDSINRYAIGEYKGITVEFPIGKDYYFINDEKHFMDTTSYISNDRTYIPIRFAAEALGFAVEWESTISENKVIITTN